MYASDDVVIRQGYAFDDIQGKVSDIEVRPASFRNKRIGLVEVTVIRRVSIARICNDLVGLGIVEMLVTDT